jgi:hypothetical protein
MVASFAVMPLDPGTADSLRAGGARLTRADGPGFPCRQCLQEAETGEDLLLLSYQPMATTTPYASASPIFLHASTCTAHDPSEGTPTLLRERLLSVRAFDEAEHLVDAEVVAGVIMDGVVNGLLQRPGVREVHIHNAATGCYLCRAVPA